MSQSRAKADAFVELLAPLRGPLEGYARRMLRNRGDVEDVLQSAVARAFAQFDRYAEGSNFKAWIFRFVTLEIFNRNRKHELLPAGDLGTELSVEESWDLATLETAHDAMLEARGGAGLLRGRRRRGSAPSGAV